MRQCLVECQKIKHVMTKLINYHASHLIVYGNIQVTQVINAKREYVTLSLSTSLCFGFPNRK